ncbi:hydantoinase B/oxoprolinase family protein [Pseudooceanicola sp. MF1-13]|uniref:hydantoinase B/oxoprolinase family protein n=1 Tax=Pseudooceanicola sp. MF1-13 TaxID=3379095 RepID=UPI003892C591
MSLALKSETLDAAAVDPITAEIISHGLQSITDEISTNITRTAHSPLVYEYKDFACGLVDPDGRLIAQGSGSIPIFVTDALGTAVRDGLAIYGRENIHRGDVIMSNHAGTLGQHLNNVSLYTPVYSDEAGQDLAGFMVVLVHWIDLGGKMVGSCTANDSTEIYQEGIQYRSIKLWNKGEKNEEIYRIIQYNTRFPGAVLGDLEAQLTGCLLGRDKFEQMLKRYGRPAVQGAIETAWDKTDQAARSAVRAIPDGVYSASAHLDDDGLNRGKKIPVDVVVRVAGEDVTVDLSGVADQVEGPLNSGRLGGAITAARIAYKYMTTPREPANDGNFRALTVEIPDGKFLSASANAAMGKYSAPLPTVIDAIIQAFAKANPDQAAAGHHSSFSSHLFFAEGRGDDEGYQHLDTGLGGWGATSHSDGGGPYKTMAHGDTLNVPAEVQEALFPHRIEQMSLRPDSGGAGTFRGGLGTEKVVRVLERTKLNISIERTTCPPWGANGGKPAEPGYAVIEREGQEPQKMTKGLVVLEPGDCMRLFTAGGGGCGDPSQRSPDRIRADLTAGYITPEAAERDYGFVDTATKQ